MSIIFVIDVDGTVCDSIPRVKEICSRIGMNENDNLDAIWTDETMKEFLKEENIMGDTVVPGAEKIIEMANRYSARMFFLTGRNEYARSATRKWLNVKMGIPEQIPLIMRPTYMKNGYTADCKEQLFLEWLFHTEDPQTTYIFFEDHKDTAKRYSQYGLVLKAPECWKNIII